MHCNHTHGMLICYLFFIFQNQPISLQYSTLDAVKNSQSEFYQVVYKHIIENNLR